MSKHQCTRSMMQPLIRIRYKHDHISAISNTSVKSTLQAPMGYNHVSLIIGCHSLSRFQVTEKHVAEKLNHPCAVGVPHQVLTMSMCPCAFSTLSTDENRRLLVILIGLWTDELLLLYRSQLVMSVTFGGSVDIDRSDRILGRGVVSQRIRSEHRHVWVQTKVITFEGKKFGSVIRAQFQTHYLILWAAASTWWYSNKLAYRFTRATNNTQSHTLAQKNNTSKYINDEAALKVSDKASSEHTTYQIP